MSRQAPKPGGTYRLPLTPRHLEIERRVLAGERQTDIAKALGITSNAVQRALAKVADVRGIERLRAS